MPSNAPKTVVVLSDAKRMGFVMNDACATVSGMPPNQFKQLLEEIALLSCRIAVAEEDKRD